MQQAQSIATRLAKRYPAPQTELTWSTPWELLVATILSAQCTDVRVNLVTPNVFATWPTVQNLAQADLTKLEAVIRSTGFYRNKAKNIRLSAQRIVDVYNGQVPQSGRGKIQLVAPLSNSFGKDVILDTHQLLKSWLNEFAL